MFIKFFRKQKIPCFVTFEFGSGGSTVYCSTGVSQRCKSSTSTMSTWLRVATPSFNSVTRPVSHCPIQFLYSTSSPTRSSKTIANLMFRPRKLFTKVLILFFQKCGLREVNSVILWYRFGISWFPTLFDSYWPWRHFDLIFTIWWQST